MKEKEVVLRGKEKDSIVLDDEGVMESTTERRESKYSPEEIQEMQELQAEHEEALEKHAVSLGNEEEIKAQLEQCMDCGKALVDYAPSKKRDTKGKRVMVKKFRDCSISKFNKAIVTEGDCHHYLHLGSTYRRGGY